MHCRPAGLALLLPVIAGLKVAAQQCYYPDGTTTSPDVPCNSSATYSACCNEEALCLDNGLCLGAGSLSRGSCTDRNWGPACAQYCVDSNPSGGIPLSPCTFNPPAYACDMAGVAGHDICTSDTFLMTGGSAITLRPFQSKPLGIDGGLNITGTTVLEVEDSSSSSASASASASASPSSSTNPTSSATSAGSCTATAAADSSSTPVAASKSSYSAGVVAAVGVGVGVPLVLALAGAIMVILRQRKQLRDVRRPMGQVPTYYQATHTAPSVMSSQYPYSPPMKPPVELGAGRDVVPELESAPPDGSSIPK